MMLMKRDHGDVGNGDYDGDDEDEKGVDEDDDGDDSLFFF